MLFQKTFTKELISVASSLVLLVEKIVFYMDLENWFVVSKKLGNFYYRGKCQPC